MSDNFSSENFVFLRRGIVSEAMKKISPDTPERLDKMIRELRGKYI
jgi:hypothetical protein